MPEDTTSESFFEAIYQKSPDPWEFGSSVYELNRYTETIAALSDQRYTRAFEPGCSIGILTRRLAPFCDRVEAIDISPTAVTRAKENCRQFPWVSVKQGKLPDNLPSGLFDLIVFSEIGYYLEAPALTELAARLEASLTKDGLLVAVHWLGSSKDHVLSGDRVHQILSDTMTMRKTQSQRYEGFRLDCWRNQ